MSTVRDPLDRSPASSTGRPWARMCPVSEPDCSRLDVLPGANGDRSWPGAVPPYTVPCGRCCRAHSPYWADVAGGLVAGGFAGGHLGSWTVPLLTPLVADGGGVTTGGGGAGSRAAPVRGWYPVGVGEVGGGQTGRAEAGTTAPPCGSAAGGGGTGGGGCGAGGTGGCGGVGCGGTGGTGPGGIGGTGPGGSGPGTGAGCGNG